MTYRYRAYGLSIESTLEIPEFAPGDGGAPNVRIRTGEAAGTADPRCVLSAPKVGRFLILGGREVVVEREGAEGSIREYLVGSVFAALLRQRGVLCLHGSAIATARGAVIFGGASGSGKSTLAAEFWRRGYRVLADDVCAICRGRRGMEVQPGYPGLKLRGNGGKRLLRLRGFAGEPLAVATVYSLHIGEDGDPRLVALKGFGKLEEMVGNTCRYVGSEHLEQVRSLAAQARVVRLERPASLARLGELAGLIEDDFSREQGPWQKTP